MTSLLGQNGPPILPDELESVARVKIRSGSTEMARRALRLIAGNGISFGLVDDSVNEEVEITVTGEVTQAELDAHEADTTAVHGITDTSVLVEDAVLDARIRAPGTALPASPADGQLFYDTDDDRLYVYNGTAWVCITPVSAVVNTSETETNTAYDDMATVGPAVTIQTGTKALVTVGARLDNSGADRSRMSYAVSGASTRAADDDVAAHVLGTDDIGVSRQSYIADLTAGVNTFTAKYRVGSGTGTFTSRVITVVGIP